MANKNAKNIADAKSQKEASRQRSTITFPYMGLKPAMEIVVAIHENAGTSTCTFDQIAAWVNQSAKSSGFRIQVGSAKQFGLILGEGEQNFRLSDLGRKAMDPSQSRQAKMEAFLNISLYKALFEKYRGGVIPPTAALERDIAALGVAEKQKDRARQAMENSAEFAGFFESGRNKLVMPAIKGGYKPPQDEEDDGDEEDDNNNGGNGGNGNGGGKNTDPVIAGLVSRLPKHDASWPVAERVKWLQTLAGYFSIVYTSDEDVDIKITSHSNED